jgi:hypothetical protein
MIRKRKRLAAFAGLLILAALGWVFGVRHPYAFEILVELEANGEPVVMKRTIRCIPISQSQGIGSRTQRFYVAEVGSFGTRLKDGSGVFLATPSVCGLRRDNGMFDQIDPNYLPLIGWTQTPDDPQTFEMYLTREAVSAPNRRVRLGRLQLTPAPSVWAAWRPSLLDDFSWFWIPPDSAETPIKPVNYRAVFSMCFSPEKFAARTDLVSAITATSAPILLDNELRNAARDVSTDLDLSESELLGTTLAYDGSLGAMSTRSEYIAMALSGIGLPPGTTPEGEPVALSKRPHNFQNIVPFRRASGIRVAEISMNGMLVMERVPADRLFDSTYDILPISIHGTTFITTKQYEAIAVPSPQSLCLLNLASLQAAQNSRR